MSQNVRFQQRAVSPPITKEASVRLCRVAPSGYRVAFAREDGQESETGVWTGDVADALSAKLIVPFRPNRVLDLAFSPDGSHIAYRVAPLLGARSTVGWARSDAPGEIKRVDGNGFSWTPGGKAILVADPYRKALLRYSLEPGEEEPRELGPFEDDADPAFPSRIAVSPDGAHIAYSAGREEEEVSEVWLVKREKKTMVTQVFTELPGANVHIFPFWSPKGATLGLFCVHEEQAKTALIVVPRLEGDGLVLYESSMMDPAVSPAFTPSGQQIALFRTEKPGDELAEGPTRLCLLDVKRETFRALGEVNELEGAPHFLNDHTLAVDGGRAAHLLIFDEMP